MEVQKEIRRYLKAELGHVRMSDEGVDRVRVGCGDGGSAVFSMNMYCDVLDGCSHEVVATSNLPRDFLALRSWDTATTWTTTEYGKKLLGTCALR